MRNFYYFTFTQYDTFIQYMKHQKKISYSKIDYLSLEEKNKLMKVDKSCKILHIS